MTIEIPLQKLQNAKHTFPQLAKVLDELAESLMTVRRLYPDGRVSDRRLFGVDLDNLISGLDMLTEIRNAGVSSARLTQGIADLSALAKAMSERAAALVDHKINAAFVHTEVAANGLEIAELVGSEDVPISQKPAKPLRDYIATRDLLGIPIGGYLMGEAICAEITERARLDHASHQIAFLPEAHVRTVRTGKGIVLWSGDEDTLFPDRVHGSAYRVEATEGVLTVRGPVFFSQAGSTAFLAENKSFRLRPAPKPKTKYRYDPWGHDSPTRVATSTGLGMLCLLIAWIVPAALTMGPTTPLDVLATPIRVLAGMAGFLNLSLVAYHFWALMRVEDVVIKEGRIRKALRTWKNRRTAAEAARMGIVAACGPLEKPEVPRLTSDPTVQIPDFSRDAIAVSR